MLKVSSKFKITVSNLLLSLPDSTEVEPKSSAILLCWTNFPTSGVTERMFKNRPLPRHTRLCCQHPAVEMPKPWCPKG